MLERAVGKKREVAKFQVGKSDIGKKNWKESMNLETIIEVGKVNRNWKVKFI